MSYHYNKKLKYFSKDLRNNMTSEEKHLWYDFLKKLPFNVKRQKIIGNYIVDFYIPSARIVIEIDGIQHNTEEHILSDKNRDIFLSELGITVLRYTNADINRNFNNVCNHLLEYLNLDSKYIK